MKILFTGAAGMLAADVIPQLLKQNHKLVLTDVNQRLPDISRLDVSSLGDVLAQVEKVSPDYVFHFGAETNVDLCEKDPNRAFVINTLGTENIALACQRYDIPLLYISTGAVFRGDKPQPYTEFDVTGPGTVYGESKLQGELVVARLLKKYFIIRAGWMVGGWEIDKKFVYKMVCQLKEGKTELCAVNDKFGTPTFTKDFAANLMAVINTNRYGVYHMANKGFCSRYDMAVKIVEFMGMAGKVKIIPVNSAFFPLPAPRARSEAILNYRLELLGLNNMPLWEESLEAYIRGNKNR